MSQLLPDITDVEPVGEADRDCLEEELRAVLTRHGRLDRFGLTLLHDHFPVASNEMLVETCDPESRTLTIIPEVIDPNDAEYRLVGTNWRFSDDGDVIAGLVCKTGCFVDLKDRHKRTHQKVNG